MQPLISHHDGPQDKYRAEGCRGTSKGQGSIAVERIGILNSPDSLALAASFGQRVYVWYNMWISESKMKMLNRGRKYVRRRVECWLWSYYTIRLRTLCSRRKSVTLLHGETSP